MNQKRKPDPPFQSADLGGSSSKPHANNNEESTNKQGYRQTLRRWFKAFLVYLACRQLLTERFVDRIVGGLRRE